MDVEEIRKEIKMTSEILDLDGEIFEHISQDICYCNRLFIIEIDCVRIQYLSFYSFLQEMGKGGERKEVGIIHSEDDFPQDISTMDCIIVISKDGEDPESIKLSKYAKSEGGLVYVISSNPKSELGLLADEFIHIKETPDFEENVTLFFSTVKSRITYYILSEEYIVANYHPLDLGYTPPANVIVNSDSYYKSPFLEQSENKRDKKAMLYMCGFPVIIFISFVIALILASYFHFYFDVTLIITLILLITCYYISLKRFLKGK